MYNDAKKELLDFIKRKGIISLDQAIKHTNLARTTLRQHLLQLERDGFVQHDYIRSGPGRPSLQYRLTVEGNGLFPSYKPSLIRDLLVFLKGRGDERTIELFFEGFWNQCFEKAKRQMNKAPENDPELRLMALKDMLEGEGFMPEFDFNPEDKMLTIKACNCPFGEVVKETILPCKLEAMFYKKLFDERVNRIACIAEGDYSCTYSIPIDSKS